MRLLVSKEALAQKIDTFKENMKCFLNALASSFSA